MSKAVTTCIPSNDPPAHPLASIFPLLEGEDFDELVEDIRRNGLLEPIVLLDGLILDGRNRWRACRIASIRPDTVEFPRGADPFAFVVSKNLFRRHLDMGQRAMIAARTANMQLGDNRGAHRPAKEGSKNFDTLPDQVSAQQAADRMNVSRPQVFHAKTILAHGTPEEIAAADAGTVSVSHLAMAIRRRGLAEEKADVTVTVADNTNVVQLGAPPRRPLGPKLPEGETPESIARKALELRSQGKSLADVTEAVGVRWETCKQMTDIVLIADRTDLPAREAEIAATALRNMNARRMTLDAIYETVRPIAGRLWGFKRGVGAPRAEQEAARIDRFEHGLGIMLQSCANAARIEVPHLSRDKARKTLAEIEHAIASVSILSSKIRSIHQ